MRTALVSGLLVAAVALFSVGAVNAAPISPIDWQRLLGGDITEVGHSVQQTADGGYVLLGFSLSSQDGTVTGKNHGSYDYWIVKLGGTGKTIQWQRLLGGAGLDDGWSVQQTTDGGYILVGSSASSESGDVTSTNHGDIDSFDHRNDVWVVKLDGTGKTIQWQRLLGGSGNDFGKSVRQTTDGGYILLGYSSSSKSGDVSGTNHGSYDYWVVKLSEKGAILWQRLLGGSAWDAGYSVDQTTDGGYVLVGSSASSKSGDVTGTNHGVGGSDDIWVVKLDANGATRWQRLLGGDTWDEGHSVRRTAGGGCVLLGDSRSSGSGDVTGAGHGVYDLWAVKLDRDGATEWQKLFGGERDDYGESVDTTADGGYVLFGSTYSNRTGQVTGTSRGGQDFWIVKLSDRGRLEWQKLLGGSNNDEGYAAHQTADGKYILLGASISSAGGDVTETSNGGWDFWAVKLNPAPILPVTVFTAAAAPHDLDEDGLYEDVNGNAKAEFADIILFFQQMNWIAENEPVELFDYNRNGGIDFADLIWLFQNL